MKNIILAAIAAIAMGTAITAHAANGRFTYAAAQSSTSSTTFQVADGTMPGSEGSSAALNKLFAEWDRAGFNAPGKPAQSRVYGRHGSVTTGGGYNVMAFLIRSAANDVREGRDQDAAPKIAKARSLLAASNLRKE